MVQSVYDPQVEFLEVGVMVDGWFSMKTYGPDLNGMHGAVQGVGGVERVSTWGHTTITGTIQDYFGNVLATITNGNVVSWSPARFTSHGPVNGYQPPISLSSEEGLAQSMGWRGKRVDETGLIYLGARLYDPVAGRFISGDPLGHGACQDLYSFCGGDPVNSFDPDGRCPNANQQNGLPPANVFALNTDTANGEIPPEIATEVMYRMSLVSLGVDYDPRVQQLPEPSAFGLLMLGMAIVQPEFAPALEQTALRGEEEVTTGMTRNLPSGDGPPVINPAETPPPVTPPAAGTGLADLAQFRQELGPIPGGGQPDGGVLARLDIGGNSYYGINAHGTEITLDVNATTEAHAEADAFQQAANAGITSDSATLYVDRELCGACGPNGGVPSMAKQLGVKQLTIVTPSGTVTVRVQ